MKKHIIALAVGLIGVFCIVSLVHANPLFVAIPVRSATATTSQTVIGGGATNSTWLSYDAYQGGNTSMPDKTSLLIQATAASSTASVLNLAFQFSDDGIDWYNDLVNVDISSTTVALSAANPKTYTWTLGTTATSSRVISFNQLTRYVRVVASSTTATTSVWGQIVPIKQQKQ